MTAKSCQDPWAGPLTELEFWTHGSPSDRLRPDSGLTGVSWSDGRTSGAPRLLNRPPPRGRRREVGAAGRPRGLPRQPPLRPDDPAHRSTAGHPDRPAPRTGRRRDPPAPPVQRPPAALRV